jgi:hypothetical protein
MIQVSLSRTDWENTVRFLTEIRDGGRFAAYLDDIIDSIDAALAEQDPSHTAKCGACERVFDLLSEDDAGEWYYGHDCEEG